MKYIAKHYHTKVSGLTFDEIPAKEEYTEYTIEARDMHEAAVIAHGFYNGYTLEDLAPNPESPCRTTRERLEGAVKETYSTSERAVYAYDNIASHWITVEK